MGVIFEFGGYQLADITMSDAPELFDRLTSKLSVVRYLPMKVHTTVQETEALIRDYAKLAEGGNLRIGAIRHKSADRLIGTLAASRHEHSIALAMKIAPERFAMGAGCILAPHFVHWLLAHDGIRRVWAYTDVDNKKVSNLLAKMGAHCEGLMHRYAVHPNISPIPRDCYLWSVVR